jgi:hypothetical protein
MPGRHPTHDGGGGTDDWHPLILGQPIALSKHVIGGPLQVVCAHASTQHIWFGSQSAVSMQTGPFDLPPASPPSASAAKAASPPGSRASLVVEHAAATQSRTVTAPRLMANESTGLRISGRVMPIQSGHYRSFMVR